MTKYCTACGNVKPLSEYGRNKSRPDGLNFYCKACALAKYRAAVAVDPDKVRKAARERIAAKRAGDDGYAARLSAYQQAKMALIRQATPAWADLNAVQAIYDEAARLRQLGQLVEVDHVVPLQGKHVTGLHVANNLAIVAQSTNRKKYNHF